jgi:hypothetical protein
MTVLRDPLFHWRIAGRAFDETNRCLWKVEERADPRAATRAGPVPFAFAQRGADAKSSARGRR